MHELPPLRSIENVEPVENPVALKPPVHEAAQLYVDIMQSPENPDGFDDSFAPSLAWPYQNRSFKEVAELWRREKGSISPREFFDRYMEMGSNAYLHVGDAMPGMPIEAYEDYMASIALRRSIPRDHGMFLGVPYDADAPGSRFPGSFPADNGPVALGKIARGDLQGALDTVDNDAYMIKRFGYPPNMNALAFIGRTQKPVISFSVEALAKEYGDEVYAHYAETLERYIEFWKAGRDQLADVPLGKHGSYRRNARLPGGEFAHHYFDDTPVNYETKAGLRAEMLAHDFENVERMLSKYPPEMRAQKFVHYMKSKMAACEGTQDFADKLYAISGDPDSIRTIDIVPSDLNAMMVHMMRTAAAGFEVRKEYEKAQKYYAEANTLAAVINKYMYRDIDETHGAYGDVLLDGTPTYALNASMAYPLLVGGIVSYERAIKVANTWKDTLLKQYGFYTSDVEHSKEQWDWDNVWPSINMWLVEAFTQAAVEAEAAGKDSTLFLEVAEQARVGLLDGIETWYKEHHNIPEKVNGGDPKKLANRGEYGNDLQHVQKGFGMTIGAARKLRGRDLLAEVKDPIGHSWRRTKYQRTAGGLIVPGSVSL